MTYINIISETDIRIDSSQVIKDKLPGTNIDYSDHQPVEATLIIKRNITGVLWSCLLFNIYD